VPGTVVDANAAQPSLVPIGRRNPFCEAAFSHSWCTTKDGELSIMLAPGFRTGR